MKAILILDMPEKCSRCNLAASSLNPCIYCKVNGQKLADKWAELDNMSSRPDWCPLKEEPFHINRLIPYGGNPDYAKGLKDGWNFCLNAIEGTED